MTLMLQVDLDVFYTVNGRAFPCGDAQTTGEFNGRTPLTYLNKSSRLKVEIRIERTESCRFADESGFSYPCKKTMYR